MSSKVIMFTDVSQLMQKRARFQLGTNEDPCEVQFGLHDIDEGATWRGITIIPSEADIELFKLFNEQHEVMQDIVKDHDDIPTIKVKVNLKTTKVVNANKTIASFKDVCNERRCKIIVSTRHWKMNEQRGICLRALAIQLIDDDAEEMEFL